MRVIHLNHSDINGGAARAAYRLHHALRTIDIESRVWVNQATAGDWTVQGPTTKLLKLAAVLRPHLGGQLRHLLKTGNPIIHSAAFLPSGWPKRLNTTDADLIHLHWIADEMLSIADIGRIRKPVVWTLHDMWAFCGAEHYTENHRWRDGYYRNNRPPHESGFDLNRWTWKRKRTHWQRPMQIVAPSHWLADCARESQLMHDWPVSVVPNVINTDEWRPAEQRTARELLGLPQDVPLLLFGAMGGGHDPRKGFDLLLEALSCLRGEGDGLELVVFGQLPPRDPPDLVFPIHYTGHLHDDVSLRILYSAADLFAIPSRQDNLPNTGVESMACGTPVIAFDTCGLPDIVRHRENGYLAKAFDAVDFAEGIRWIMQQRPAVTLRQAARQSAIDRFSPAVVVPQYLDVYRQAMEMPRS